MRRQQATSRRRVGLTAAALAWIALGLGAGSAGGGTIYHYRDAAGARFFTNVPAPTEESAGMRSYDEIPPVPSPPGALAPDEGLGRPLRRKVTSVHRGVALFRRLGTTAADLRRLDRFLEASGRALPRRPPATPDGATHLLGRIAALIDTEAPAFSGYLDTRDCRRSILYAAVGEAFDLPISLAALPGHLLVHYRLPDGGAFWWETTADRTLPTEYYLEQYGLTAEARQAGGFLAPLPPEAVLARFHRERADLAKREGRLAAAERHYSRSIALYPGDYAAFTQRGSVRVHLGREDEALADYRQALDLYPDDPVVHYNLGSLFARLRRYGEALASLDKAVRLDAGYAKALDLRERIRNGR